MTVSGDPVVADLVLTSGKKLTLGDLETGADITVTAEGVFTNACELAADFAQYFKTTVSGKTVAAEDNVLTVG